MSSDSVLEEDKSSGASVADYLSSANKKKKKIYVAIALGKNFDYDIRNLIMKFVEKAYPHLNVAIPTNFNDLRRMTSRSFALFIVDDNFLEEEVMFPYLARLKAKQKLPVPLLFLTEDIVRLNRMYQRYLNGYHEVDDFIPFRKSSHASIVTRIRNGIENKNGRRSRRYRFDKEGGYRKLGDSDYRKVHILDMSVHGGYIKVDTDDTFRVGEQIQLSIYVQDVYPEYSNGDFMYLSCRVKRVGVSGNACGVQFVNLQDKQTEQLERFLLSYVNQQIVRGRYR